MYVICSIKRLKTGSAICEENAPVEYFQYRWLDLYNPNVVKSDFTVDNSTKPKWEISTIDLQSADLFICNQNTEPSLTKPTKDTINVKTTTVIAQTNHSFKTYGEVSNCVNQ